MRVHPLLEAARHTASLYQIKPSERGFNVWRFWPWESEHGGWRIVVRDAKSREDARLHVLRRFGLTDETPPEPHPPQTVVRWSDPEWFR